MIMKGQKINDRYQIIKSIGEGGMANVYLAYDTILDRNVAVKVLRGDLAGDEKFVRRFQREALSASSLSHTNIVEVYDVGEDNGNYYIVMEYIEGKHLKSLIKKRGKLTLPEVIDIMSQICEGMAVAHDSYIIHRDIKPQNIMILDSGLVKITDFGIAMALNSTQLTQTNSVMGSVHYLPPEQASGKGATIQSDIYSMGILMYELLTGELPFRGDNAVEIALKQLKEVLPDVTKKVNNCPNSIINILRKSTAKNPKNRYTDAREMYDDIKTALDPKRKNEELIEYKYPEFDEKDKAAEKIKKEAKAQKPKKEDKKEEIKVSNKLESSDEVKKENKLLITLGAIFTGLVVLVTAIVVLLPRITSVSNTKVPDVVGMEEIKAEAKLLDAGLKINSKLQKIPSDEIKEGKVVKTDPSAGRTVKEGTEITIYVSSGPTTIDVEDFTGRDYKNVKDKLEHDYGIIVMVEKKEIEGNPSDYDPNEVIDQSPKKGEKIKAGDTLTLYIPDIESLYPDFTTGEYTLTQIEEFCKQYNLKLVTKYVADASVPPGTIVGQSRPKNTKIQNGATIVISIAEAAQDDVPANNGATNE